MAWKASVLVVEWVVVARCGSGAKINGSLRGGWLIRRVTRRGVADRRPSSFLLEVAAKLI